ncbi:MAG: helix-hairpin-helix domain-containing protein [Pseudomonadota bacterium]
MNRLLTILTTLGFLFSASSSLEASEVSKEQTNVIEATEVSTLSQAVSKIAINTASAEEIAQKIKGIGIKKAQTLVEYREANGAFQDEASLTAVKGIGPSLAKKIAEAVNFSQ